MLVGVVHDSLALHRFLSVLPREWEEIIREVLGITRTSAKHIIQVSVWLQSVAAMAVESCGCRQFPMVNTLMVQAIEARTTS